VHICYVAIDWHKKGQGGGIASYVKTLGEAIVERGNHVSVIAKSEREHVSIENGMTVCYTKLGNIHWYLAKLGLSRNIILTMREIEWSLKLCFRVLKLNEKKKIDVIELGEWGYLAMALFISNIPLVLRLHGERSVFDNAELEARHVRKLPVYRRLELAVASRFSAISSPSKYSLKKFKSDGVRCEHLPMQHVIPNPLHPRFLCSQEPLALNRLDPDYPSILYSATLERRKGIYELVQAVSLLVNSFKAFKVVIVGAFTAECTRGHFIKLIKSYSIEEYFDVCEYVDWEQMPRRYQDCQIFAFPSRVETFGISLIEAMASELAVVATSGSGPDDIVTNNISGLLVPINNPNCLAIALKSLLVDKKLREKLGKNARKVVLERYMPDIVAEESLRMYGSLLR